MHRLSHSNRDQRSAVLPRNVYNSSRNRNSSSDYDNRSPRGRGGHQGSNFHNQDYRDSSHDWPITPTQMPSFKKSNKNNQSPQRRQQNTRRLSVNSSCQIEAAAFLNESWQMFSENFNGKPDESIVRYTPKNDLSKDFIPFDIDKFLAESLLKAVDLDQKIVIE